MQLMEQWRAAREGTSNTTGQFIQAVLVPPFQSALVSFVACVWDFAAETTHPARCSASATGSWRTVLLLLPQLATLVAYACQFLLSFKRRIHILVAMSVVVLLPVGVVALIHSGFRMGIGLCCCSRTLCPITLPAESSPDTAACGLVLSNCYMAFIRKIAHFFGTAGLVTPMATLVFATLSSATSQHNARDHCRRFLAKTRHQ